MLSGDARYKLKVEFSSANDRNVLRTYTWLSNTGIVVVDSREYRGVELINLRQHQENADNNLLLLRDKVQGMEKNQQQMLSFLVMVMQSPGFLVQLLHPKENNWRMAEPGSIVEQGADEEQLASDGMIISPFLQNVDDTKQDTERTTDTENEIGTAVHGTQVEQMVRSGSSGFLTEEIDKSKSLEYKSLAHGPHSEKSENLEIRT
ncbi:hypothetical protein GH714_002392 [Hevea brasiliensis]|uniref:Uncharacterized protein n=1 Tax=Hevea brasiliensis TaxID=3981 RepID=A0A6A6MLD7_HEVBR|nr:hypothetical protein GH714_002392 [Hevea brasiliensis]